MLMHWIQEHVEKEYLSSPHLLVIPFYEKDAEKQEILAFFQKLEGENVFSNVQLTPFISITEQKKLAAACEISRTPTLLFYSQGIEIGRFNRFPTQKNLQAALFSLQVSST